MPRIPRGQIVGHVYHVMNRGSGGAAVRNLIEPDPIYPVVGRRVLRIHDEGLAAGGIRWRFVEDLHSQKDVHGDYIWVKRGTHAGSPECPLASLGYALGLVEARQLIAAGECGV